MKLGSNEVKTSDFSIFSMFLFTRRIIVISLILQDHQTAGLKMNELISLRMLPRRRFCYKWL